MSTRNVLGKIASSKNDQSEYWGYAKPLKRKFESLLPSYRFAASGYPSPPMSNPPSPPRQPTELSLSTAPAATASVSTATSTNPDFNPTSSTSISSAYTFAQPLYPPQSIHPGPYPTQAQRWPGPPPPLAGLSAPHASSGDHVAVPGPALAGSSTNRTARRSKTHVASACVNCKRAHLSCDVQRPCARCVASGKQDSCVDVVHKKRGRPRLRDDGESQLGQTVLGSVMDPESPIAADLLASREYARPRHRRGDSLRSLRSHTSDQSPQSGQPTPIRHPPTPMYPPPIVPPPPPSELPPADVPTAFLDLNLVLIRANGPFKDILASGREVKGMRLSDVVVSVETDGLERIRAEVRAEREAREPAYMPPILHPGQDPIQGVTEADIDRLTQGFVDRTQTWSRSTPGSFAETFPGRVRLGKANTYFLAVTLPTFRPRVPSSSTTPLPPPPTFGANDARFAGPRPPSISPASHYLAQYAGPSTRTFGPPLYSPYPGPVPSQRSPPSSIPLAAAEPPTGPTPFTPRNMAVEPEPRLRSPVQLPPLFASAPGPSTSQAPQSASTTAQRPGGSDEDEDGEPKKRRRVGISDVLQ